MKKEILAEIQQVPGTIPVLLLAGHAHLHKRPSLMGTYKLAEPWTDYIVRNIAEVTGAHALYTTMDLDYDPNFHTIDRNPFLQAADELVTSHKIKYVFDFHGLSDKYSYDIGVYYLSRFTKSKYISFRIADALNNGHLAELLVQLFNFKQNKQVTLTENLVKKYKLAGVQIEIARYIREDEVMREALIKEFSEFVLELE